MAYTEVQYQEDLKRVELLRKQALEGLKSPEKSQEERDFYNKQLHYLKDTEAQLINQLRGVKKQSQRLEVEATRMAAQPTRVYQTPEKIVSTPSTSRTITKGDLRPQAGYVVKGRPQTRITGMQRYEETAGLSYELRAREPKPTRERPRQLAVTRSLEEGGSVTIARTGLTTIRNENKNLMNQYYGSVGLATGVISEQQAMIKKELVARNIQRMIKQQEQQLQTEQSTSDKVFALDVIGRTMAGFLSGQTTRLKAEQIIKEGEQIQYETDQYGLPLNLSKISTGSKLKSARIFTSDLFGLGVSDIKEGRKAKPNTYLKGLAKQFTTFAGDVIIGFETANMRKGTVDYGSNFIKDMNNLLSFYKQKVKGEPIVKLQKPTLLNEFPNLQSWLTSSPLPEQGTPLKQSPQFQKFAKTVIATGAIELGAFSLGAAEALAPTLLGKTASKAVSYVRPTLSYGLRGVGGGEIAGGILTKNPERTFSGILTYGLGSAIKPKGSSYFNLKLEKLKLPVEGEPARFLKTSEGKISVPKTKTFYRGLSLNLGADVGILNKLPKKSFNILGISREGIKAGTPKLNLADVKFEGIKTGTEYFVQTPAETQIFLKNLESMKVTKSEANRLGLGTELGQKLGDVKSRFVQRDILYGTKYLSEQEAKSAIEFFTKKKARIFGSFSAKQQMPTGTGRTPADIEGMFSLPLEQRDVTTEGLLTFIKEKNPQTKLYTRKDTGQIFKMVKGKEQHAIELKFEGESLGLGTKAWGVELEKQPIFIGKTELSSLGEQFLKKSIHSGLEPQPFSFRTTLEVEKEMKLRGLTSKSKILPPEIFFKEGRGFAPKKERSAKDIYDVFNIGEQALIPSMTGKAKVKTSKLLSEYKKLYPQQLFDIYAGQPSKIEITDVLSRGKSLKQYGAESKSTLLFSKGLFQSSNVVSYDVSMSSHKNINSQQLSKGMSQSMTSMSKSLSPSLSPSKPVSRSPSKSSKSQSKIIKSIGLSLSLGSYPSKYYPSSSSYPSASSIYSKGSSYSSTTKVTPGSLLGWFNWPKGGGGYGRQKKGKKISKQKTKYQPSLFSVGLGLTGRSSGLGEKSGLGLRPVPMKNVKKGVKATKSFFKL